MGVEFELKFRANKKQLEAIRAAVGGEFTQIQMETTYYDTPDGALSARHWTLRHRRENGLSICTVKTPGENGCRGEWECQCENIKDAVEALCKLGAPAELAAFSGRELTAVCAARFTRLARLVKLPEAEAEVALDSGVLLGGGKELPFAEAEVELKSGSREAVSEYARSLAKSHGLSVEKRSKYSRARRLRQEKT